MTASPVLVVFARLKWLRLPPLGAEVCGQFLRALVQSKLSRGWCASHQPLAGTPPDQQPMQVGLIVVVLHLGQQLQQHLLLHRIAVLKDAALPMASSDWRIPA